jgi:hypothetical protein
MWDGWRLVRSNRYLRPTEYVSVSDDLRALLSTSDTDGQGRAAIVAQRHRMALKDAFARMRANRPEIDDPALSPEDQAWADRRSEVAIEDYGDQP